MIAVTPSVDKWRGAVAVQSREGFLGLRRIENQRDPEFELRTDRAACTACTQADTQRKGCQAATDIQPPDRQQPRRELLESNSIHLPILTKEIADLLQIRPGIVVVDGTFGGGGHTDFFLKRMGDRDQVIALDRDPRPIELGQARLGDRISGHCANYADLPEIMQALGIESVDAILLDLGLSSDQLADDDRGFSYHAEGPLDLRFNPEQGEPAWKLLEYLHEKKLADLIYEYGEERFSRVIARRICERRRQQPIRTASELATLLRQCVPRSRKHAIDPATRTFQALRIAVNEELKWLQVALRRLPDCLSPGGRLAIISFHSLEDRLVKHAFLQDERLEVVTRRPVRPSAEEIETNSRSRSAKLRVATRRSI